MYRHNPFEYKSTHTSTVCISNIAHIYGLNIYASPHLFTSSNTNTTYTLIRRSLTDVKNAEQFESLGDLIVRKFFDLLKSTDMNSESDVERLRKMIEVVGVVCSMRQGSRLNGILFVNIVDGLNYNLPI